MKNYHLLTRWFNRSYVDMCYKKPWGTEDLVLDYAKGELILAVSDAGANVLLYENIKDCVTNHIKA